MIKRSLQGLGVVAFGDPAPGPGVPAGMSYSPGFSPGRVRLVSSRGRNRDATYRQIYDMNPFVYAATNYIARGISRLPLHVFALDANAEKQRLRADVPQTPGRPSSGVQLDRVLNVPGGRVSRAAFFGGTMRQRLIYGNALWEILRDGGGAPTGLERIPWQSVVHIQEDGYGRAEWYEVKTSTKIGDDRRRLFPSDVIHFGLGSEGDQACGVSLLESCHHTLALHEALLRHLLGYFENSARPSGHLKMERAGRQKAEEIRALVTELYASPENAGKILVTSGEWQPMSDSPDHAQIVELIKESRVEISAAFQTPPPILGLLENAIRANVKEMREQYGRDTLGPWASEIEDELEAQLIKPVPSWSNVFAEFQLAEQLRPDLEARALVYQRLMHIYTIDEIRTLENMAPLKIRGVTDVPWVASGAMPLKSAAAPRAPRVSPPPSDGEEPAASLHDIAAVLARLDAIEGRNGHHDNDEVLTT